MRGPGGTHKFGSVGLKMKFKALRRGEVTKGV